MLYSTWWKMALCGVLIGLLLVLPPIIIVVSRRKRVKDKRKYYLSLEIPDDGSRPAVTLATILKNGSIKVIPWSDLDHGKRLGAGAAGEVASVPDTFMSPLVFFFLVSFKSEVAALFEMQTI